MLLTNLLAVVRTRCRLCCPFLLVVRAIADLRGFYSGEVIEVVLVPSLADFLQSNRISNKSENSVCRM